MKRANTLFGGLTSDPFHDLPLFAAACHTRGEEINMIETASVPTPESGDLPEPDLKVAVLEVPSPATAGRDRDHPNIIARDDVPAGSLTVGKFQAAIAEWHDVDPRIRRNWASSIATMERILRLTEGEGSRVVSFDRWTCGHLNELIWELPPSFHSLERRSFGSVVSNTRQVLMRLGLHADSGPRRNVLSPRWEALYAALPTPERRKGLVRFFRFLTLAEVEPKSINKNELERFEAWLRTETLTQDIPALVRRSASNWHWARQNVAGWPDIEMTRPRMRDLYTTPIEVLPEAFQADVAAFIEGLKGGNRRNPFRDAATVGVNVTSSRGRRSRAVSLETIRGRLFQIRAAVAALLAAGIPRESLTGLRDLVTPADRPRIVLQFHLDRLKARVGADPDLPENYEPTSTHVAGIAELLRIVAVHHVQLPIGEVAEIQDLHASVRMPIQGEMNEVVAKKLRALNDPDVRAMLLYLPETWMKQLSSLKLDPLAAAREAMYATALEIALVVPLRRRNLVGLHRDRHLVRDNRTGRVVGLDIPAAVTKTRRRPITWDFPPRVAAAIDRYEREFLPILAEDGNRHLFPGLNGRHREKGEFANELSRRVERAIGVHFNLHLIRHLTAYRILKQVPGAYELVSRVLGHATPKVTMAYYCGLEMIFAVREATRLLELDRVEARPSRARAVAAIGRLRAKRRNIAAAPPGVSARRPAP